MATLHRARTKLRTLVDRVAEPYVQRIIAAHEPEPPTDTTGPDMAVPPASPPDPSGAPSDWFHGALHELRTIELERLEGRMHRVLSVGASGRWYFDWFESCVGPLDLHVGVEAFEPMPSDLPANARWLATTADRFEGVGDNDMDAVFAGQTAEHLWADELTDFLLESNRVLHQGGSLVLDSPNRLVTEHLAWSHGGHTVELAAGEMAELLDLAGFAIESTRGIWRCRFGDEILQLEDALDRGDAVVRRITSAGEVDDCFVWWIVARRQSEPRPELLRRLVAELFDEHWPTRACRGLTSSPREHTLVIRPGADVVHQTLPFHLRPGKLQAQLRLVEGSFDAFDGWDLEILDAAGRQVAVMDETNARADAEARTWDVDVPDLLFAASLRLTIRHVNDEVRVAIPLGLSYRAS